MIRVIVLKHFQRFEKVKGTPFKNSLLFHVDAPFKQCLNGVMIQESNNTPHMYCQTCLILTLNSLFLLNSLLPFGTIIHPLTPHVNLPP